MYNRGSITVFFTLLLSIMISLISTMLMSAKVAAGRVQIALAMDQTMLSAMAKYDRQLFEEYHLFYIDGGYGTSTLQLGMAFDELESDLSYLLTPNKEWEAFGENFLQLENVGGAIIGYTLATDCNGGVFKEQVVSYMKDTLGIQAAALLTNELSAQMKTMESQEQIRMQTEETGSPENYENIKQEALEAQKEQSKQANQELQDHSSKQESQNLQDDPENQEINDGNNTGEDELSGVARETMTAETIEQAKQADEVIETVSTLKESAILSKILPATYKVSDWTASKEGLLSERTLQLGMGYLELTEEDSMVSDVLFQEYILQNLNYYQSEKRAEGPAYGVEWIAFEKPSDLENLEAMANRLLLIREAANVVAICLDSAKMAQVGILAGALSTMLVVPYLQLVFEAAIILAWAYAESLVEVSALFHGGNVPLVKNAGNWQVSFAEILGALQRPYSYYKETTGMSYEDYLRVMLAFKSDEEKVQGCMEVIELSMKEIPGKEHFSMDCAVDALEVKFQVRSQDRITFDITRQKSYRTI